MDDIISTILDMDKKATEKIEKAREEANKLLADAKAEEERIIREARSTKKKQEKGDRRRENKITSERIRQIEAQRDEEFAALEQDFSENMDKRAEELFQKIINFEEA